MRGFVGIPPKLRKFSIILSKTSIIKLENLRNLQKQNNNPEFYIVVGGLRGWRSSPTLDAVNDFYINILLHPLISSLKCIAALPVHIITLCHWILGGFGGCSPSNAREIFTLLRKILSNFYGCLTTFYSQSNSNSTSQINKNLSDNPLEIR